jgi:hypothetical protein
MNNSQFVNFFLILVVLGILSFFALPAASAQEHSKETNKSAAKQDDSAKPADHAAPAAPLDARFAKLAKLAGKWKGTATHGGDKNETTVSYKLIGSGSALVETLFEGTPHEMITVYHMDGSDLVMTHYCASGNQPRCKAVKSEDANTLKFDFTGGANINPDKDVHMHSLTITFASDDKVKAVWTSWTAGKPSGEAVFELERAK